MKEKLHLFLRRMARSRDFTISVVVHVILVALFGTVIMTTIPPTPPVIEGEFARIDVPPGPPTEKSTLPVAPDPSKLAPPPSLPPSPSAIFSRDSQDVIQFSPPSLIPVSLPAKEAVAVTPPGFKQPSTETINNIEETVKKWLPSGEGKSSANKKYDFTVFVGQYNGGNWNSTVRVKDHQIVGGSLPNLIYYLDKFSGNRIRGNEKNIRVIKLDSDALLEERPPFIFLTGTQDFTLTEKEVENLRGYLKVGGAIWGDSSVPGLRSRFDIAFRREMKRVVADKDKDFEALPYNHPLFTKGYFPAVKGVAEGLNYYQESIYVLKVYGQIGVIYTANDYSDMWQIGLWQDPATRKAAIDTRRDENLNFVAINPVIYHHYEAGAYLHNLSFPALEKSYQFGGNIIVHLLSRWDDLIRNRRL